MAAWGSSAFAASFLALAASTASLVVSMTWESQQTPPLETLTLLIELPREDSDAARSGSLSFLFLRARQRRLRSVRCVTSARRWAASALAAALASLRLAGCESAT